MKPFDTYLKPEFWVGVNGIFTNPLKKLIEKNYTDLGHAVSFTHSLYDTALSQSSDMQNNDICSHERRQNGYCRYKENGGECPVQPVLRFISEPEKDMYGKVYIPFEFQNCCCKKNRTYCVLIGHLSYEKNKVGIKIGTRFYEVTNLEKINIATIEYGIFKPYVRCNECERSLQNQIATDEVSKCFGIEKDELVSNTTTKFLSLNCQRPTTLIGKVHYPMRYLTKDCGSKNCANYTKIRKQNKKTCTDGSDGSGDSDGFGDSDDYDSDGYDDYDDVYKSYRGCSSSYLCEKCKNVKSLCNSGKFIKTSSEYFTLYKSPVQKSIYLPHAETKFMSKYLFEQTYFSELIRKKMHIYSICVDYLPSSIIRYIYSFLNKEDYFNCIDTKILIQLESLEDPSNNLTLVKKLVDEQKYLVELLALVNKL